MTLPQQLRHHSRVAATMFGYGCPSPTRGRLVWRLSLAVPSRPHLRPPAWYEFGRLFYFSRVSRERNNYEKTCVVLSENDARGPTLEFSLTSAIVWIQARGASPLALTTCGVQGTPCFSRHVKQFPPREIYTHSTWKFTFSHIIWRKNQLQIKIHSAIPSVCTNYMCLSNATIQFACCVE